MDHIPYSINDKLDSFDKMLNFFNDSDVRSALSLECNTNVVSNYELAKKNIYPKSKIYFIIGHCKLINRDTSKNEKMNNLFRFINCHQCGRIDDSKNMIICSRVECTESFCFICIKKYYVNFIINCSPKTMKLSIA